MTSPFQLQQCLQLNFGQSSSIVQIFNKDVLMVYVTLPFQGSFQCLPLLRALQCFWVLLTLGTYMQAFQLLCQWKQPVPWSKDLLIYCASRHGAIFMTNNFFLFLNVFCGNFYVNCKWQRSLPDFNRFYRPLILQFMSLDVIQQDPR